MSIGKFCVFRRAIFKRAVGAGAAMVVGLSLISPFTGSSTASERDEEYHRDYIFGVPIDPSEAWNLASGARLYDNWYSALAKEKPKSTHPAWPSSNTKKSGAVTWRCKSCHGWDYSGKDGAYSKGSYKTGITGIRTYDGKDEAAIHKILMDETHGYTHDMIPLDAMLRISAFVSKGQIAVADYVKPDKTVLGDTERGKAVFQNVCAACHGFDGKALNWGDANKPAYIGTEAQSNPWEILHKIRAGHPGAEMPAMMAFPVQTQVDVLSYAKTLPAK